MRRSILQAGAWTALGLAAAFAVVSANSSHRRAVTTAAPSAKATVASVEKCTPDACCAREAKVAPAAVAATVRAPKTKVASRSMRPVGVSGLVVAIDPATGDLGMPSPEQMTELESLVQMVPVEETSKSDAGLVKVVRPNGTISVDLQGRGQEFGTVRVGPNGKLIMSCDDRPAPAPVSQTAPAALEEK